MSRDVDLRVVPLGDARCVIEVSAGAPHDLGEFDRAVPQVPDETLRAVEGGNPEPWIPARLADATTDWLLGPAVSRAIEQAMTGQAGGRVTLTIDDALFDRLDRIPFEAALWTDATPVGCTPRLRAFSRRIDAKSGASGGAPGWPPSVLVVRAAPTGLGDVPLAKELRDDIVARQAVTGGAAKVTLFSVEDGADGPATWASLLAHVRDARPDVLVFLGHGATEATFAGEEDALVFEDDTRNPYVVRASRLVEALRGSSVRAALLVGCATARGGPLRSVAQSLVTSGVGVAVGMRAPVYPRDAASFVASFFEALLGDTARDVEAAAHAARRRLADNGGRGWLAPVLYAIPDAATLFATVNVPDTSPLDAQREPLWDWLHVSGAPDDRREARRKLDALEDAQAAAWTAAGVTAVVPSRVELVGTARQRLDVRIVGAPGPLPLEGELRIPPEAELRVAVGASPAGAWRLTRFVALGPGRYAWRVEGAGVVPSGACLLWAYVAAPPLGPEERFVVACEARGAAGAQLVTGRNVVIARRDPITRDERVDALRTQLDVRVLHGRRYHVADGHVLVPEEALDRYADDVDADDDDDDDGDARGLVALRADGRVVRWRAGVCLRYRIVEGDFGPAELDTLRTCLDNAVADWERTCGVRFEKHAGAVDDDTFGGGAEKRYVDFTVRKVDVAGLFVAAAFDPRDPADDRVLRIDESFFGDAGGYDPTGVLRHELGHVLGFRHEHARPDAPVACEEAPDPDAEPLTEPDTRSVMRYFCKNVGNRLLTISKADRLGAQRVYGLPSKDVREEPQEA